MILLFYEINVLCSDNLELFNLKIYNFKTINPLTNNRFLLALVKIK